MFLGTFKPSVVGRGRIALPKKIREELKSKRVVLTIGFETCVFGFSEEAWNEVVRPELEKPFFSDAAARNMRRKMGMNAMIAALDSQGRVVVPDSMLLYAGIENNITLIGAGDHFELWDTNKWKSYAENL